MYERVVATKLGRAATGARNAFTAVHNIDAASSIYGEGNHMHDRTRSHTLKFTSQHSTANEMNNRIKGAVTAT
jgi:hypothetical protein